MTRPEGGRVVKPCRGCGGGKPIYTDGEDFFKWDPERQLYRSVNHKGDFHPIDTHPGCTEVQLMKTFGSVDGMSNTLRVATEHDILWRTFALVIDCLVANKML
jgi:hypothetical protein